MTSFKNCILEIDLNNNNINRSEVSHDILRQYVGGSGLASRLFLERGNLEVDLFSGDNEIYIMTGPLTGTKFPGTGRFTAVTKSPLTGIWGESNCGGNFGPELKFAGFDGIIIKGIASKPVYILIEDNNVQICDASEIWGKDAFQVTELFKKTMRGNRKVKVLSIGPAGENLVRFAAVLNDKSDTLGRCGLGAVMGSKKLKAILVRGSGEAWKPIQDSEYNNFVKLLLQKIKDSAFGRTLHMLGTNAGMVVGRKTGDIPMKNWSLGVSDEYAKPILPYHMFDKYFVRHKACFACPVGCKKEVKVDAGKYKVEEGPSPEYESFASFGTMLLIKDMEALIKINNLCNRYGLDVISCGSTIAFAFECFEKGLIQKEDMDGLELKWGDADVVIEIIKKIAYRDGIGNLLAEGSRLAAMKMGEEAKEYAVEVKGLELPMHDPRAFYGHGLAYATSNRGACHLQHLVHFVETNTTQHPELGLLDKYERQTNEGKALMTVICEDFGMIMNAAPICQFIFGALNAEDLVYMLKMATGFDYTLDEVKRCGERLWYMKRSLNNIMGVRASDDRLPKKVMVPLSEGGAEGKVPDLESMLNEYYQIRKINSIGIPQVEKLRNLGLYDLFEKKYPKIFKDNT